MSPLLKGLEHYFFALRASFPSFVWSPSIVREAPAANLGSQFQVYEQSFQHPTVFICDCQCPFLEISCDWLTVVIGFPLASVLGSLEHPVTVLDVYGVLAADGQSPQAVDPDSKVGGPGGGSGGSVLLFLQTMILGKGSLVSTTGGQGGAVGGGGGAGGRVHFHWADIPTGEDYVPIASPEGLVDTRLTSVTFWVLITLLLRESIYEAERQAFAEDEIRYSLWRCPVMQWRSRQQRWT